ncbi:MAG: hypothetical protein LBE61_01665 [Burkholderiaceae bacterium]|jgi:hypothetical protein|nr:hypothetical protein [Burkholderiaceae bacterium]
MMPIRAAVLGAAGVLLALAQTTLAQAPAISSIPASAFRSGEPEVIKPSSSPSVEAPAFPRAAFASAYARAGRPTIAVLWNREFSDRLEQSRSSQVRVDSTYASEADILSVSRPGRSGVEVRGHADGVAAARTTITAGEVRQQQPRRDGPEERMDMQVRAGFLQAMVSAGVKLVDRNVAMRTTALRHQEKAVALDSQRVETEALAGHALLLMEVLSTRDTAAPLGWSYHVSVRRMADGLVLSEGYMDGLPSPLTPPPQPRFEADPRGGFREMAPPITAGDVGRRVGEQTLIRLGDALSR